jgi:uncharacterized repeat protein (TIGR03803 family)
MIRTAPLTVLLGILFTTPAHAGFKVLHSFNRNAGEGYYPLGALLQSGSTLFGMTNSGGTSDYGTVFQIETDGTGYSELHSFHESPDDGGYPWYGSLIQSGSMLFGMTLEGGTNTGGTIFQIGTDGTSYRVIHDFTYLDGGAPYGSLLKTGSKLYGMTSVNGANDYGTVFEMEADGADFRVLHAFNGENGAYPHGSLIQSGSTLFGMTMGDRTGVFTNRGTIFRMESDGSGFSVLHSFNGADGGLPHGSLVQSGTTLYGMTLAGGPDGPSGGGTIFRIETDGTGFELLHSFAVADGLNPYGSLLLSEEILYGVASNASGGSEGAGTVFQIGTDGADFRVLHEFSGSDGGYPYGTLIQSGSTLYGTTTVGGEYASGVVFSLDVPEPPSLALFLFSATILLGWPKS